MKLAEEIKLLESKGAINNGSFSCRGSFSAREFTSTSIFGVLEMIAQGHPNDRDVKAAERFIMKVLGSL